MHTHLTTHRPCDRCGTLFPIRGWDDPRRVCSDLCAEDAPPAVRRPAPGAGWTRATVACAVLIAAGWAGIGFVVYHIRATQARAVAPREPERPAQAREMSDLLEAAKSDQRRAVAAALWPLLLWVALWCSVVFAIHAGVGAALGAGLKGRPVAGAVLGLLLGAFGWFAIVLLEREPYPPRAR